jgi:hypothetical protein
LRANARQTEPRHESRRRYHDHSAGGGIRGDLLYDEVRILSKAIEEMLATMTVGARLSGERSVARPQHEYGDPSNFVKFPGEVARKEEARKEKAAKLKKQKQSKHQYMRKLKG